MSPPISSVTISSFLAVEKLLPLLSSGGEGRDCNIGGKQRPGPGWSGQQLKFIPDILAGHQQLALLLLVVEVLLFVAVEIGTHGIMVQVIVTVVGKADIEWLLGDSLLMPATRCWPRFPDLGVPRAKHGEAAP